MFPLPIFPTNGFDTSILTPVLVGLGFLAIFAETLGWGFVGLVVPGYLAAVGIAAPASAITIMGESCATYLLSRAVGIWIPETNAWTVFFGRERFFLLIMSSVVVRLASEGYVLPYVASEMGVSYASELYSIGLVLVPLVANSFWNIGFLRGSFQLGIVATLTYFTVKLVFLPLTNLSLSRFELTYESVALDFLASSKAYVILLCGTMLAQNANVRFGWDFNGILVPGLLTVAWYEPVKLGSTFVEAFVVAMLARKLVATPLFSRALIEGPRRTVLVFVLGYLLKYTEGVVALWVFPGEQITDFYGFGYVLPSLLAVKVWHKTSPGKVLMPAFQVSLAGFIVGNALGYALGIAMPYAEASAFDAETRLVRSDSVTKDLIVHVAGERVVPADPDSRVGRAVVALAGSTRGRGRGPEFALGMCSSEGLRVAVAPRAAGGTWWIVRRSEDGKRGRTLPAVALTRAPSAHGLVVAQVGADGRGVGTAMEIADSTNAGAVLVLPRESSTGVVEAWSDALLVATGFQESARVVIEPSGDARIVWSLGVDRRQAVSRLFEGRTTDDTLLPSDRVDEVWPAGMADPVAALDEEPWKVAKKFSASVPAVLDIQDEDERHAFETVVAPAVRRWQAGDDMEPRPAARAAATALGLRFSYATHGDERALLLTGRADLALDLFWLATRSHSSLVASSPDVHVHGVVEATRYTATVAGVSNIVLAREGARRSLYEVVHRGLLGVGKNVIVVRSMPQDSSRETEIVLTDGDVVRDNLGTPEWANALEPVWTNLGAKPVWYDGSFERWRMRGATDSVLAIGYHEGHRQTVIAWFSSPALDLLEAREPSDNELAIWKASGWRVEDEDVAARLVDLLESTPSSCDWDALMEAFARYRIAGNPFALRAARAQRCEVELGRDTDSGRLYVMGRTAKGARLVRADALGHAVEVDDLASARLAVHAGAGSVLLRDTPPASHSQSPGTGP